MSVIQSLQVMFLLLRFWILFVGFSALYFLLDVHH